MITFDEVKARLTPPSTGRCESQREFDAQMNQLRRMQTEMTEPLRERLDAIFRRRREIGRQMEALNLEKGSLNRERDELSEQIRQVGSIFYDLKKELIRENPKAVPPTAKRYIAISGATSN